jgi:formylglycine-generating enzyme required for sulfatase activity/cytoskeletal protein CcmA (bactofilin family)
MEGNLSVSGSIAADMIDVASLELTSLDVSGNSLMSGDLDVTGTLTTANLTVSELDVNEIIQSATPLNVSRNMIVNGDLDVTGILSAGYLALSELDVSGNSLMSGNLDVTGILTAGTLDVTALSLNELEITDNTPDPFRFPLNVSGNTRLYQPNSVNGKALSVTGDTYMQGLVEIDGNLSANQLDVTMISSGSSLEINNDLVVNGNLDATGTTHLTSINTMQNALDVSGNSLMSGNLAVTGDLSAGILKVSSTTFNTVASQERNITFNDVSGTVMVTGFSSINSSTTLNASHNGVILASGTISLTLPDPTTVLGTTYTIKKTDSSANNVTIIGLVDNVNNPELLEQYSYITIVSDGSAWYKVAEFVAVPEVENPATIRNSLGMTFQLIPAGTFVMGSPIDELGRGTDESQYTVTLTESFYMQTTEVTQGQWEMVMNDNPSNFIDCGLNCPVENISWEDAENFIITLNAMGEGSYTFPTEAQWEYAARSGSNKAFANADISYTDTADPNLDIMGWYDSNSNATPHAVAQKQANAWGLFDMHGNVWEWCNDWYDTYPTGSVTDPGGPSTGSYRVIRGGSWYSYARLCRSAKRSSSSPGARNNGIGLRLSRTP